eukprot:428557_1
MADIEMAELQLFIQENMAFGSHSFDRQVGLVRHKPNICETIDEELKERETNWSKFTFLICFPKEYVKSTRVYNCFFEFLFRLWELKHFLLNLLYLIAAIPVSHPYFSHSQFTVNTVTIIPIVWYLILSIVECCFTLYKFWMYWSLGGDDNWEYKETLNGCICASLEMSLSFALIPFTLCLNFNDGLFLAIGCISVLLMLLMFILSCSCWFLGWIFPCCCESIELDRYMNFVLVFFILISFFGAGIVLFWFCILGGYKQFMHADVSIFKVISIPTHILTLMQILCSSLCKRG